MGFLLIKLEPTLDHLKLQEAGGRGAQGDRPRPETSGLGGEGEGWEPPCDLLGVEVIPKDKPLPHLNDRDCFGKKMVERGRSLLLGLVAVPLQHLQGEGVGFYLAVASCHLPCLAEVVEGLVGH